MKGITIASGALLFGVLVAGCGSMPAVPGREEPESEQPQDQGDAPTFAGTWTRQGETPRVFDVTDDGTTVHGALRGTPNESFASYTFDLTKQAGGALKGKAHFELADMAGKTFETAWEAKLEGTTISVKAEELALDEAGEIAERTKVDHKYDLEAAAAAAPAEYVAPAMDMSAYVTPLGNYKHVLGEEMAVGQWVDMEMITAAGKSVTRTAVVGDAGDAWIIEMDNQMNQKDLLVAVFVNKETGDTTKAFVGNRGKDGTEKTVTPPPATQAGEAPTGTDEEVTVPAGTYAAKRFDVSGSTSWMGAPGTEAEGVMLKMQHSAGGDELTTLEKTTVDVSGTSYEARHLVYTSGNDMTMALSPKPFLNQVMLKMKSTGVEMGLVGQGTDASPQFNYPR
jgi:hypothetical protein